MNQPKSNPPKTMLTITAGFLVVFALTQAKWALFTAIGVGITGVFSSFLSTQIEFLWFKLAKVLSFIVPNILLSAVFFIILFPIAFFSRILGKKDPLHLKNTSASLFKERSSQFTKESFEHPW